MESAFQKFDKKSRSWYVWPRSHQTSLHNVFLFIHKCIYAHAYSFPSYKYASVTAWYVHEKKQPSTGQIHFASKETVLV